MNKKHCRHKLLLDNFSEVTLDSHSSDDCDNCANFKIQNFDQNDVTLLIQAIDQLQKSPTTVAKVLAGKNDKSTTQFLNHKFYGKGKKFSQEQWRNLIEALVGEDFFWLSLTVIEDKGTITNTFITKNGTDYLESPQDIEIKVPKNWSFEQIEKRNDRMMRFIDALEKNNFQPMNEETCKFPIPGILYFSESDLNCWEDLQFSKKSSTQRKYTFQNETWNLKSSTCGGTKSCKNCSTCYQNNVKKCPNCKTALEHGEDHCSVTFYYLFKENAKYFYSVGFEDGHNHLNPLETKVTKKVKDIIHNEVQKNSLTTPGKIKQS